MITTTMLVFKRTQNYKIQKNHKNVLNQPYKMSFKNLPKRKLKILIINHDLLYEISLQGCRA